MEEKKKAVLDFMKSKGKPLRTGDISKALGMESKEVSKVIKALKEDGKVFSPKRCYWAPSED